MEWVLPLVAAIYLFMGIRVVTEAERIAVHRLGRFAGFREPGLHFRMPGGADVWSRVRLGMRGMVMSPELAAFGEAQLPIESATPLEQGRFVRIQGFSKAAAVVALDAEQRRTMRCQRCGHENEMA